MLSPTSSSTMAKPKSNKQHENKVSNNSDIGFWLRKHWYLSSAIKLKSGGMMITEGTFQTHDPTSHFKPVPPKNSNFILIFSKLDQYPPANQSSGQEARLPNGLAIKIDQWNDFKKAFARYFMMKESKSQHEINLMFGLTETSFANDKVITDITQWNKDSLQRDSGLVLHSKNRASAMARAIKSIPPYGMVDAIDGENDDEDDDDESELGSLMDGDATEVDEVSEGEEATEDEEADEEDEGEGADAKNDGEDETKTEAGSDFEGETADSGIKRKKEAVSDSEADVVVIATPQPQQAADGTVAKKITTSVDEKKKTSAKKSKPATEGVDVKSYANAAKTPVSGRKSSS